MIDANLRERVPGHVRDDQIVDFDYSGDWRIERAGDVQIGMHALHSDAPDIFYSPRNGGFWVVTRLEPMSRILSDPEHFSSREFAIPRLRTADILIPGMLDPPDHLPYRLALMRHFEPKRIKAMESTIRGWANRLIDPVIDEGRCEFAEQVGAAFPVSVFMELMGLPLERLPDFRKLVNDFLRPEATIEEKVAVQQAILAEVAHYFDVKRREPGDDLMTKLLDEQVNGRKLTDAELLSIGQQLFFAGLDTVANTLAFTFNHLAQRPDLQARLAAQPQDVPKFVEEALRRFSIIQLARLVTQDTEVAGAQFREGDMVVCSLPIAGLDERANPNPETFDLDREHRAHLAFGAGPHTCLGMHLARLQIRVLIEEWLRRIPSFSRAADPAPRLRSGGIATLFDVYLEWPRPQGTGDVR